MNTSRLAYLAHFALLARRRESEVSLFLHELCQTFYNNYFNVSKATFLLQNYCNNWTQCGCLNRKCTIMRNGRNATTFNSDYSVYISQIINREYR